MYLIYFKYPIYLFHLFTSFIYLIYPIYLSHLFQMLFQDAFHTPPLLDLKHLKISQASKTQKNAIN